MLVTVRDGYAFRLDLDAVDAWRFGSAVTRAVGATPNQAESLLSTALRECRGAAFHEFTERPWALPAVTRLTGLRQTAVERFASACLDFGRPAEAVAMHRVEPPRFGYDCHRLFQTRHEGSAGSLERCVGQLGSHRQS